MPGLEEVWNLFDPRGPSEGFWEGHKRVWPKMVWGRLSTPVKTSWSESSRRTPIMDQQKPFKTLLQFQEGVKEGTPDLGLDSKCHFTKSFHHIS